MPVTFMHRLRLRSGNVSHQQNAMLVDDPSAYDSSTHPRRRGAAPRSIASKRGLLRLTCFRSVHCLSAVLVIVRVADLKERNVVRDALFDRASQA